MNRRDEPTPPPDPSTATYFARVRMVRQGSRIILEPIEERGKIEVNPREILRLLGPQKVGRMMALVQGRGTDVA